MPDAVSATLKQLRHRPAPPPGHPTPVSYGWPGGGAGRRRFSKADKDSNQARRVCQRADLPAASRITTSRLFNPSGAPPMAEPFATLTMTPADADVVFNKLGMASGRGRVCRLVLMAVVSIPFKKKTKQQT